MAQALVPLKDLVRAKTRLAGMLSPSERRALAQAMLEDVLVTLAGHPDISTVTLVSDDPAVHLLAGRYGTRYWTERELRCRGLNAVVGRASDRLLAQEEEPVLVLHADLPLLGGEDISAVLASRREVGGLVIGCDRHGNGTNLLCFDRASAPRFCFGADSCRRHVEWARAHDVPVLVLRRPGIELDIDEPQDLAALLAQPWRTGAGHTPALLRDTGLGTRIELALASLSPQALALDEEGVG